MGKSHSFHVPHNLDGKTLLYSLVSIVCKMLLIRSLLIVHWLTKLANLIRLHFPLTWSGHNIVDLEQSAESCSSYIQAQRLFVFVQIQLYTFQLGALENKVCVSVRCVTALTLYINSHAFLFLLAHCPTYILYIYKK